jgi:hypothetical protein
MQQIPLDEARFYRRTYLSLSILFFITSPSTAIIHKHHIFVMLYREMFLK